MTEGWDDDWVGDLGSWDDVAELLCSEWDRVEHPASGLSLASADGLLAFDLRGRWRARHRRGLHRLGFRPVAPSRADVWLWDVLAQLRDADLSQFASPLESIFRADLSAKGAAKVTRLRTSMARDHLVRQQALRVLRDVFRCETENLDVLLFREDGEWWDEEEAWSLPGR